MNGTLKRFFVASAAVVTLSTALLVSGAAQSKPYVDNDTTGQTVQTNVSPADQDASILSQH